MFCRCDYNDLVIPFSILKKKSYEILFLINLMLNDKIKKKTKYIRPVYNLIERK
jgi:hypothetical protein